MINKNYLEDYINNLEKSLYPNITYLIKNELLDFIVDYSYIWKNEIFSKNKDINKVINSLMYLKAESEMEF
jgi:hypothetical protein